MQSPGKQGGFIGALLAGGIKAIGGALVSRTVGRIATPRNPAMPGGAPIGQTGGMVFNPNALGSANIPAGAPSVIPLSLGGAMRGAGGAIVAGGTAIARYGIRNRRRIVALARSIGVGAAATALGISAVDVADAVVRSRPRARGITGRQFANAKRVNRKVLTMACQLSELRAKTKRACK